LVDYDDDYVQPLILSAMKSLLPPESYVLLKPPATWSSSAPEIALADIIPEPAAKILQIMPYESIDFDYAASHDGTCLVNSYMIRKALIRKHFLSATVDNWVAKHPESVLKSHVKRSEAFEVDYAEFLDDALVEAWDLRESMEKNASSATSGGCDAESVAEQSSGTTAAANQETQWWILKPSMSDRGQGIRLFSTMEQLQEIFDGWEPESEDEEEEKDEDDDQDHSHSGGNDSSKDDRDGITTSHLRHFVAQPYIHPPLLIPSLGNRKFHIRVYALAVGSLRVYVYRDMLALFAAKPYQPPGSSPQDIDLDAHLTNTCLQTQSANTTTSTNDNNNGNNNSLVYRFRDLPLSPETIASVTEQICAVTGELFEAAARGMMVHFQPQPHAFEVFGLDFLVDAAGTAWLLEVNAFPDFKQTGPGLTRVVAGFWRGVVNRAVKWFVLGGSGENHQEGAGGEGGGEDEDDGMVLVRDVDLGRRRG
jgi:regulator of RNase E activity RraB